MPYFPLQVHIPEPCHENWDQMQLLSDGRRHCASCSRNLVDFSVMTDREIHQYLREQDGRICGRWRRDQLARPIYPVPPQRRGFRAAAVISGLLAAANLSGQETAAPAIDLPNIEIVDYQTPLVEQGPAPQKAISTGEFSPSRLAATGGFQLQGQVTDENGEPLIGAYIWQVVQSTGTITDLAGQFTLNVIPGELLQISYVGYEDWEVLVNESHQDQILAVRLVTGLDLPQVVVVAEGVTYSKGYMTMGAITCYTTPEPAATSEPLPFQDEYLRNATLFPNPVIDFIGLELQPTAPTKMVAHLFTIHGTPLRSWAPRELEAGRQEQRFSISRLPLVAGHYYLVLEDQTGTMETRVVVVQ
ncbi:MAG: carboxypeptidase-like regulatory domain-containing protein [Bacteroidota bacterium]